MTESNQQAKNYFMFSATVVGQVFGASYSRTFNVLVTKDKEEDLKFTMKDLGYVQQVAQLRLSRHLAEDYKSFITEDVVVNSMVFLGTMTQEEFEGK